MNWQGYYVHDVLDAHVRFVLFLIRITVIVLGLL